MKTSNILLLGFLGAVMLAFGAFDFVVKNEIEKQGQNNLLTPDYISLTKQSFKHIKIKGIYSPEDFFNITQSTQFEVKVAKELNKFVDCKLLNDTLFIDAKQLPLPRKWNTERFAIECPVINSITVSDISGEFLLFQIDKLSIFLSGKTQFRFNNNNINRLKIVEKNEADCRIYNHEEVNSVKYNNQINSLEINLKDKSRAEIWDIPMKFFKPVVGDSAYLSLSGASLKTLLK